MYYDIEMFYKVTDFFNVCAFFNLALDFFYPKLASEKYSFQLGNNSKLPFSSFLTPSKNEKKTLIYLSLRWIWILLYFQVSMKWLLTRITSYSFSFKESPRNIEKTETSLQADVQKYQAYMSNLESHSAILDQKFEWSRWRNF